MASFLEMPHGLLAGPAFDSCARTSLSKTSKSMRTKVIHACTAITVKPAPADNQQLQTVVDRLRHCCDQGLELKQLSTLMRGEEKQLFSTWGREIAVRGVSTAQTD
ncbi:hypothetical protein DUNSADRAFT_11415 [Dunaliella salina]|uniref:Encoded protein n=1 Tax=Dunaliella salina TaxID=3046 RepID=A0ABQ7GDE0_DUNSA|nr:hypothetical protein DUNSADRAFT_11415 [Dunaliella salina]|eukprot:KAF5832629.1 hypothetical protein DUNSADRAFT_11415 [Dunaliella salina]